MIVICFVFKCASNDYKYKFIILRDMFLITECKGIIFTVFVILDICFRIFVRFKISEGNLSQHFLKYIHLLF